jgi:hypothetical protein
MLVMKGVFVKVEKQFENVKTATMKGIFTMA